MQTLKVGRMPRADTRLGKLCRRVETQLYADVGSNLDAGKVLKIGLVLQMVVCIAGLPLLTLQKKEINPAYKWAVDTLRGLLNELYQVKPGNPKHPKGKNALKLEEVLSAE